MTPSPGFRPPPPGGFPSAQNIGPYPRSPSYPSSPSGYPQYPTAYQGYPRYPGYPQPNQNYGTYQGGGGPAANNAPVPDGYYVYKPQDNFRSSNDSSAMDKVKKYGLPILGAGVATYALSKLTDNFGLGDSDSD